MTKPTKHTKPKLGRPPKEEGDGYPGRINCRLPQSYMDAFEVIRRDRPDRPDVAQVVRELLGKALASEGRLA